MTFRFDISHGFPYGAITSKTPEECRPNDLRDTLKVLEQEMPVPTVPERKRLHDEAIQQIKDALK